MKKNLDARPSLIEEAEQMAVEHECFTEKYVVSGRKALYVLLGKMMSLAERFDAAGNREELIENLRYILKERYGIKTQENTADLTVLVRYITRADRKTAHVYSRVIESARENGIKSQDLAGYIEHHGGVERIRSLGVESNGDIDNAALKDEELVLANMFLSARTEIPFASFKEPTEFKEIYSNSCAYEYVICSLINGEYKVVGKLPADPEFEHLAIKKFSSYLCKDIELARNGVSSIVKRSRQIKEKRLLKDHRVESSCNSERGE